MDYRLRVLIIEIDLKECGRRKQANMRKLKTKTKTFCFEVNREDRSGVLGREDSVDR